MERNQFPFTGDSVAKLQMSMQKGGPAEKVRSIDLATGIVLILAQQQNNDDAKRVIGQLLEQLQALTRDSSPSVQAWANTTLARIMGPADRLQLVGRMADDPEWKTRLLAVASMTMLKPEEQRTLLKRLTKDTEPIVLDYANSVSELLAIATTNPSVLPSTNPAAQGQNPATGPATKQSDRPFGDFGGPLEIGPGQGPGTGSGAKPSGDVSIPPLPLALPPATQPAKR